MFLFFTGRVLYGNAGLRGLAKIGTWFLGEFIMKSLWMVFMLGVIFFAANNPVIGNAPNVTDDETISITISPNVLVLGEDIDSRITIHTNISGGLPADLLTLTSNVSSDSVTATSTFLDNLGHLVVKFDRAAVENIVAVGEVILTLTFTDPELTDGDDSFAVSDTIVVKEQATAPLK